MQNTTVEKQPEPATEPKKPAKTPDQEVEEIFFPPEGTKKEAPEKENPEQQSRTPKRALKRVFRPRAPIPNFPDYDSDDSDTSTLVGEEAEDETTTVVPKKKK